MTSYEILLQEMPRIAAAIDTMPSDMQAYAFDTLVETLSRRGDYRIVQFSRIASDVVAEYFDV